jgi:aconitate hydratase
MGILPLQFLPGENAESLKLKGEEIFEVAGIRDVVEKFSSGQKIAVRVKGGKGADDKAREFQAVVRIDTPQEALYYANGGILQYVLRQLLAGKTQPEAVTA